VSTNIIVRFPDPLAAALKAEQARTGCSVSEFIRRAVIAALEKKSK
jgi:hypothetical protein